MAISLFTGSWIVRDSRRYFLKNNYYPLFTFNLLHWAIGLIVYWFFEYFLLKKSALMIKPFDFYFDFVSPYSFLAHKEIRKIESQEGIKIGITQYSWAGLIIYMELKRQLYTCQSKTHDQRLQAYC